MKAPPKGKNRLSLAKSPYLLQHQNNPVDWYEWGPEAFEKAREENKVIFLSVGYATCHWCHVMEHESFENNSVAAIMNEHFVNIKVDREERPDVDQIYMTFVQQSTGSGGWPMSVWLTPDRKPFVGGTYFPPEDKFGRRGFKSILLQVAELWKSRESDIRSDADSITKRIAEYGNPKLEGELNEKLITESLHFFDRVFDDKHGGFGGAPKFPQPSLPSFLLRLYARSGDTRALEMVESQLRHMARGGIYDQLGGGFARYSTDAHWLVPHFEKMLYDNAQLLKLYCETYRVTKKKEYVPTIRGIAEYVLRDMTDEAGGFHSAEDADSEGVEGKFYVWTRKDVQSILGEKDSRIFSAVYDVTDDGNWTDPHHDTHGWNILHLDRTPEDVAKENNLSQKEVIEILERSIKKLFDVRAQRIRPGLDDKVLTSWNGMMIGAMAYAGATLHEPRYIKAASRAAEFVTTTLYPKGELLHRYRKGEAGLNGLLEDYAFLTDGLLELYEVTFEEKWIRISRDLNAKTIELFHDKKDGGFFTAQAGQDDLISRFKDVTDGALPAANNVAIFNLIRLADLTGDESLKDLAHASLKNYAGGMQKSAAGFPVLLIALDWHLGPSRQVVLAGPSPDMQRELSGRFLPRTTLVHAEIDARLVPMVKGKTAKDGKPTAYVCVDYSCQLPTNDLETFRNQLDSTAGSK